jgi:outer membrane beta-barrel protein
MRLSPFAPAVLLALLGALPLPTLAQDEKPANEQVIVPQVQRRDVKLPRFPSNDFELGVYGGTYATQNFGSSVVGGLRLGYHVTEDIFVEGVYGRTKVDDELVRQVFFASPFPTPNPRLTYYNVSVGYNVLPGEVFIGRNRAKASALYLIGGIGSTQIDTRRSQTVNVGLGARVFMADWAALQVDMRQHMFSLDLLGKRQHTRNLELTGGLTFFF